MHYNAIYFDVLSVFSLLQFKDQELMNLYKYIYGCLLIIKITFHLVEFFVFLLLSLKVNVAIMQIFEIEFYRKFPLGFPASQRFSENNFRKRFLYVYE